jgi:hypothetical protein
MSFASPNIFKPLECTTDSVGDILAEWERRAKILSAAEKSVALQDWLIDECRKDPWFFVTNFLFINRPDLHPLGYKAGIAPYLNWQFHKEALYIYLGHDGWKMPSGALYPFFIYKSRATGGSVVLEAGAIYNWLFEQSTAQIIFSCKQKLVDNNSANFDASLFGKLRFFIQHLPKWMKQRLCPNYLEDRPRKYDRLLHLENPHNGNLIMGSSTTPNAERGSRALRIIIDEANSIPFLSDLLGSLTKVGPVCCVSSVKGSDTLFARYCQGEVSKLAYKKGESGIIVRKFHYSQKPEYNLGTEIGRKRIEDLRAVDEPEIWQAEMECNFEATKISSPKIFGELWRDDLIIAQTEAREFSLSKYAYAIGAFDFGQNVSLSTYVYAFYDPKIDKLLIYNYLNFSKEDVFEIAAAIKENGLIPHSDDHYIGDGATSKGPETVSGMKRSNLKSWFQNLKDEVDINVRKVNIRSVAKNHDLFRKKIKEGKILFAQAAADKKKNKEQAKWPSCVDAVKNYSWNLPPGIDETTVCKDNVKPKKDKYSHPMDAMLLIVEAVWKKQLWDAS